MEDIFVAFGIPVAICVILPITITFIVSKIRINKDNKRSEIIIKAIESNANVDTDKLIETLNQPTMSVRELQYRRLLRGCLFSLLGVVCIIAGVVNSINIPVAEAMLMGGGFLAVGVSYMIVYFVARRECTVEDESKKDSLL